MSSLDELYMQRRMAIVGRAQDLTPSMQFDLAASGLANHELEEAVTHFNPKPQKEGWGFANVFEEMLSREPRRVPVEDLAQLQNNLKQEGYLPPDHPADGVWGPDSGAAFNQFDRDNGDQVRQGNSILAGTLQDGIRFFGTMLPRSVIQGVIGTAKGIVEQTPETLERAGALGGAAAGAGIGAAAGATIAPFTLGASIALGAAIGGIGGFISSLLDDDDEDGNGNSGVLDALHPFNEGEWTTARNFAEDAGFVATAASFLTGAGTAVRGAKGLTTLRGSLNALDPVTKPGFVMNMLGSAKGSAALGGFAGGAHGLATGDDFGDILQEAAQGAAIAFGASKLPVGLSRATASPITTKLRNYASYWGLKRINTNPVVKGINSTFTGGVQINVGGRYAGGFGSGEKDTAIERNIREAPVVLPEWADILGGMVLLPNRMLPVGLGEIGSAARKMMGNTAKKPYYMALETVRDANGAPLSKAQIRERVDSITPEEDLFRREQFGLDELTKARVETIKAEEGEKFAIRTDIEKVYDDAHAEVVRWYQDDLDTIESKKNIVMAFSTEDPFAYSTYLVGLEQRGSGMAQWSKFEPAQIAAEDLAAAASTGQIEYTIGSKTRGGIDEAAEGAVKTAEKTKNLTFVAAQPDYMTQKNWTDAGDEYIRLFEQAKRARATADSIDDDVAMAEQKRLALLAAADAEDELRTFIKSFADPNNKYKQLPQSFVDIALEGRQTTRKVKGQPDVVTYDFVEVLKAKAKHAGLDVEIPEQITIRDTALEATGEELLHGTSWDFERFEIGAARSRFPSNPKLSHFYFTDKPEVAERFASATGHKVVDPTRAIAGPGATEVDLAEAAEEVTDVLPSIKTALNKRINKGERLEYIDWDADNPVWTRVDSAEDIPQKVWDDASDTEAIRIWAKGRTPRVVREKVYGKTLDLRNIRDRFGGVNRKGLPEDFPEDLAKRAAQGDWSYFEYHGKELIEWAKQRGYGKIRIKDAYESGGESVIAIPDFIGEQGLLKTVPNPAAQSLRTITKNGYKLVSTGRDIRRLADVKELAVAHDLGDYTKRASFFESAGLSPFRVTEADIGPYKQQNVVGNLNQASAELGISLPGNQAFSKLMAKVRTLNNPTGVKAGVVGPFRVQPGEGSYVSRTRLQIQDLRQLTLDDIVDALQLDSGLLTKVDDPLKVAQVYKDYIHKGMVFGGEVSVRHPGDSVRMLMAAFRVEGLPGASDYARQFRFTSPPRALTIAGGVAGAGVGAREEGVKGAIKGGIAGSLALGSASYGGKAFLKAWPNKSPFKPGTYGYLPNNLHNATMAMRYSLGFFFDLGRRMEQGSAASMKYGLPFVGAPKSYARRNFAEDFGGDADNVMTGIRQQLDEVMGRGTAMNADDMERRASAVGITGFSQQDADAVYAHLLIKQGKMTRQQIQEAVYSLGHYGPRSGAERSLNFVLFPFSFQKKMLTILGDFMLQEPARALLVHEGMRQWYETRDGGSMSEKWAGLSEKYLPIAPVVARLNNLSYGFSGGRFVLEGMLNNKTLMGKISQGLTGVFVPGGPLTPLHQAAGKAGDQMVNFFTPIFLTGEDTKNFIEIWEDFAPAVREIRQVVTGYGANQPGVLSEQVTALSSRDATKAGGGGAPWYQLRSYNNERRMVKAEYEDLAQMLGYSSVDGFLASPMGAPYKAEVDQRLLALGQKYPTGLLKSQYFESSTAVDDQAKAELIDDPNRSAAEEMIVQIIEMENEAVSFADMLGMTSDEMLPRLTEDIRGIADKWGDDVRFRELWDRFFAYRYGPVARVVV